MAQGTEVSTSKSRAEAAHSIDELLLTRNAQTAALCQKADVWRLLSSQVQRLNGFSRHFTRQARHTIAVARLDLMQGASGGGDDRRCCTDTGVVQY